MKKEFEYRPCLEARIRRAKQGEHLRVWRERKQNYDVRAVLAEERRRRRDEYERK